ncbi:hypothetical protein [Pseudoclavibacter sp. 13-3]|uniref:hypothetical protein n=1 Tax=Pseudoclavibacter sp. 13-3 TaxID=2901228 RepID=UPI001E47A7E1|nr:hypothetical protein [Pseudoclavibacter sp. 13-3]MCD7101385.1 hypothetical protein [Pseudoclavibacter sp. 13-3]
MAHKRTLTPHSEVTAGERISGWLKKTWPALVLVVLALIFIFQNTSAVTLVLFGMQISGSFWIFTVILLLIGILIGWLLGRGGKTGSKS